MNERELYHHGIKGQKWGIRRYQNPDGTLTALGRKRQDDYEKAKEEARSKLLRSSDASEIYEYKDLLTTAEINERIDRINKEASLASLIGPKKNSVMDRLNNVIKWGDKINELTKMVNSSPIFKSLAKKFADKYSSKEPFDLEKIFNNMSNLSDKEVENALKRAKNEQAIEQILERIRKKKSKS